MMNEFEMDMDVPMTIKVKFVAHPAEPPTWGYDGGYPGHPAQIDDLEFYLITKDYNLKTNKWEDIELPLDCPHMHDQILGALTHKEWEEICFEHLEEEETDRRISRYQDRIDNPCFVGGDR